MRLLIVKDEQDVAAFIKKALLRENYAVDVLHDGLTAKEFIAVESYDLTLLGIMLPGKDGLNSVRDMRSQDAGTPALLLTARGDVSDLVAGLDAGDYLVKPFAGVELRARAIAAAAAVQGAFIRLAGRRRHPGHLSAPGARWRAIRRTGESRICDFECLDLPCCCAAERTLSAWDRAGIINEHSGVSGAIIFCTGHADKRSGAIFYG